ncbi:fused MFS/spermidine synthase [Patescibacteria group bacterium]|nr:fused MFS/spermidine synthase [Patescibacteria group bacterium]
MKLSQVVSEIRGASLEFIVFVCGAVVMILELVGTRILAPYLGTSIFVWTSLIGIILGSLSLGYWWGGKIADKHPNFRTFSQIILLSALACGLIIVIKGSVLGFAGKIGDLRLGAVFSATILFAPASVLLGMISPFAVRLKMHNLGTSGATVGQLYAISTIGSIFGTFLAGFYLLSLVGNTNIVVGLALALCLLSFLAYRAQFKAKIAVLMLVFIQLFTIQMENRVMLAKGVVDIDTEYSRVMVAHSKYHGQPATLLITNPSEIQSGSYPDRPNELVFEYTKYYTLDKYLFPDFKSALMIGGGAYSYPKYFLANYPDKTLDVVEIDPMFTELAKQYFGFVENKNIGIYHEDGRTFLARNDKKYDIVYVDAFHSSYSIPFHLTTREAVGEIYRSLSTNGAAIINTISAIEGEKGKFFRAEFNTYKSVFPYVYALPVSNSKDGKNMQNIVIVAMKNAKIADPTDADNQTKYMLSHVWQNPVPNDVPILTDEFAPVDQYIMELL